MDTSRIWVLVMLASLFLGCGAGADGEKSSDTTGDVAQVSHGKALMEQYCGLCHAVPSPGDLDQKTWRDYILVRMGAYMGVFYDNVRFYDSVPEKWLEPGEGGERVLKAGIYPSQPMLSQDDFMAIREYILGAAPGLTTGPPGAFGVPKDLQGFRVRPIRLDTSLQPFVSAVEISEDKGLVYAGLFMQPLLALDKSGRIVDSASGFTMPVEIRLTEAGLSVVDIGSMGGSDAPQGSYKVGNSLKDMRRKRFSQVEEGLMRPVQSHRADLDGDGDEDLLLCEFGYHLGKLVWHERVDGGWVEHVLFPDDGAVAAGIEDFNKDGLPDIAVLQANSDEKLVLYVNKGKGEFESRQIARYPPSQGGAAMELVDIDGDGKIDLVTASGDNGDYPPTLKPIHGLRIYLNKGDFSFEEQALLPMNGAYGTRCRDYDLDGDIDIAAISYYPDYKSRPEEAFIYYEQTSPGQFSPHTIPQADKGRWMVMDAGDIDQDGDQDIVLGAFNVRYDDKGDASSYQRWVSQNVSLLLLENTARFKK